MKIKLNPDQEIVNTIREGLGSVKSYAQIYLQTPAE